MQPNKFSKYICGGWQFSKNNRQYETTAPSHSPSRLTRHVNAHTETRGRDRCTAWSHGDTKVKTTADSSSATMKAARHYRGTLKVLRGEEKRKIGASRFHAQRGCLAKWKRKKNSFRQTKSKKVHYQQPWGTRNIFESSLDERTMLGESRFILNKELKISISEHVKDKYRRYFYF